MFSKSKTPIPCLFLLCFSFATFPSHGPVYFLSLAELLTCIFDGFSHWVSFLQLSLWWSVLGIFDRVESCSIESEFRTWVESWVGWSTALLFSLIYSESRCPDLTPLFLGYWVVSLVHWGRFFFSSVRFGFSCFCSEFLSHVLRTNWVWIVSSLRVHSFVRICDALSLTLFLRCFEVNSFSSIVGLYSPRYFWVFTVFPSQYS